MKHIKRNLSTFIRERRKADGKMSWVAGKVGWENYTE